MIKQNLKLKIDSFFSINDTLFIYLLMKDAITDTQELL